MTDNTQEIFHLTGEDVTMESPYKELLVAQETENPPFEVFDLFGDSIYLPVHKQVDLSKMVLDFFAVFDESLLITPVPIHGRPGAIFYLPKNLSTRASEARNWIVGYLSALT